MIIDIAAIYDLIKQVGQELYLCELTETAGDIVYGIPKTQGTKKRKIQGYLAPKSSYQIATVPDNNQKKEYTAYIPAGEFSYITATTFIEFETIFYQIEQSEPIIHEGKNIVYRLTLTRKQQKNLTIPPAQTPSFQFDA